MSLRPQSSAQLKAHLKPKDRFERCATCHRLTWLTFHHLIPKKMHRRPRFKKCYSKEVLQSGIFVCRQCHDGIHRTYDEMTLAKQYSDLQTLIEDQRLKVFFHWVSKQKISK